MFAFSRGINDKIPRRRFALSDLALLWNVIHCSGILLVCVRRCTLSSRGKDVLFSDVFAAAAIFFFASRPCTESTLHGLEQMIQKTPTKEKCSLANLGKGRNESERS